MWVGSTTAPGNPRRLRRSNFPANVGANSTGNPAVSIRPHSFISGDVDAAGMIQVQPPSRLLGALFSYDEAQPVPSIDLSTYDPQIQSATQNAKPFQALMASLQAPVWRGSAGPPAT